MNPKHDKLNGLPGVACTVLLGIRNRICSMFGCNATLDLTTKLPATSGKSLPAGGVCVSQSNVQKVAFVRFGYARCEACPRFHALWQRALDWVKNKDLILAVSHCESNPCDCHRNVTQISDNNAVSFDALIPVSAEEKHRLDTNTNPVPVESSPSIHNAKNSAEKAEAGPGNGSDQGNGVFIKLHSDMLPNETSSPAPGRTETGAQNERKHNETNQ